MTSTTTSDPLLEQLLASARPRALQALPRRERLSEAAFAAAMLAAVAALLAWGPHAPAITPATALGLVACYAVAARVRFRVGAGTTAPTQLVLMPMLLLAPPWLVPLLAAGGMLVARLPDWIAGRSHPDRALLVLPDAWHAVAPAAVIALAGSRHAVHRRAGALRRRLRRAGRVRRRLRDPARAGRARRAPAPRPAPALRRHGGGRRADPHRRAGRDRRGAQPGGRPARPAARGAAGRVRPPARAAHHAGAGAVERLPRHGAAAGRPARGRRRVHGRRAQPRRGRALDGGRRGDGRVGRRGAGPRVRGAPARHRQDPRPRRDPQQARAAQRPRVGDRQAPPGRGPAHARPGRRTALRRRRDRPRPPRARGRHRLPRRPDGRAHPARRADHRRLRRLQRDDDDPLVPARARARGRHARLIAGIAAQFDGEVVAALASVLGRR